MGTSKKKKTADPVYFDRNGNYDSRYSANISISYNYFDFYSLDSYPYNFKDSGFETLGEYNGELITLLNSCISEDEKNKIKTALILNNFGLICKKVNKGMKTWGDFRRGVIDFDDLIQEAIVCFLDKITTFDPAKGYTLNTYVLSYMEEFIKDYVEKNEAGIDISPKTYRKMEKIVNGYREAR